MRPDERERPRCIRDSRSSSLINRVANSLQRVGPPTATLSSVLSAYTTPLPSNSRAMMFFWISVVPS